MSNMANNGTMNGSRMVITISLIKKIIKHMFPNGPKSIIRFYEQMGSSLFIHNKDEQVKLNKTCLLYILNNFKDFTYFEIREKPSVVHDKLIFKIEKTKGVLQEVLNALLLCDESNDLFIDTLLSVRSDNIISQLHEFNRGNDNSKREFIRVIKTYLPKSFQNIVFFGSVVYDFENSNDIDIISDHKECCDIIDVLELFFDVTLMNGDYSPAINTCFGVNTMVRTICVKINSSDIVKIDIVMRHHVNYYYYDMNDRFVRENLFFPDFIETSLSQLGDELFLRYEENLSLDAVMTNIRQRKLTPVLFDVRCKRSVLMLVKIWKRIMAKVECGWTIIGEIPGNHHLVFNTYPMWYAYGHEMIQTLLIVLPNDLKNIVCGYVGLGLMLGVGSCAVCGAGGGRKEDENKKINSLMVTVSESKIVHLECMNSYIEQSACVDLIIDWFKCNNNKCIGKIRLMDNNKKNKIEIEEDECVAQVQDVNDGWQVVQRRRRKLGYC